MRRHHWLKGMHRKTKISAVAAITIIVLSTVIVFVQTVGNQVQARTIRVACVGDSITEGSGYTTKLCELLGENYSVGNFGEDGSTVTLASDKPYMEQDEFQEALNFRPDIIVVMLGTNDARPDFQQYNENFDEDYIRLLSYFQELKNKPQIWVVKSPPIQNNSLEISAPFFNKNVIPQIEHVADDLDLPTIDVYGAFGNRSDYFWDGVHPNSNGAALIASTVYNAITSEDVYYDTNNFDDQFW